MFVAEQQLTSLSPRREILCNQNMIARGYAAELSVARSTMRVNSPVLAVRRMLSFSAKKTRRFSWVFCCFDREILSHNHYLIARDGYAAELSVARSTMPNYRKCATFMSLKILQNEQIIVCYCSRFGI